MLAAKVEAFRLSLEGKTKAETDEIAVRYFCAWNDAEIHLKEHENASTEMAIQYQQMKTERDAALKEIDILRKQNQHLTGIQTIQTKDLFGRSTEKAEDVLGQVLNDDIPNGDPLSEESPEETGKKETDDDEKTRRRTRERVKRLLRLLFGGLDQNGQKEQKRRMDLSKLPVQTVFDYNIEELNCKYGEGNWRFAFWSERKTVERVRQTSYVKSVFKPIVSVGLDHQLIRPVWENALIPKSVASPSLLSEIIVDWGRMFLPLYRQEMNEERFGFSLSRQRMSSWIGYVVRNYLQQVYLYLCGQLKKYSYQQCDETYWQVVLDERKAGAKSFIWVHRSGELLPGPAIVAYCYEKTRGADHLRNFYAGILQMIFLTCDAYSAYPCFAGETGGLMILTGCYMHCRRRFVEAVLILKLNDLTDDQIRTLPEVKAVALIAEIYIADNALKEMSADKRQKQRQEKVRPKVNAFFDFIRTIDLDDPLVSDKLRDAVRYALNQEENLRKFLDDGNIPLDNGASERSVRPVAQFRRNSLFSFTTGGAEVMVVIFTLIETAKANQADPYYYLKYLLEQMPGADAATPLRPGSRIYAGSDALVAAVSMLRDEGKRGSRQGPGSARE